MTDNALWYNYSERRGGSTQEFEHAADYNFARAGESHQYTRTDFLDHFSLIAAVFVCLLRIPRLHSTSHTQTAFNPIVTLGIGLNVVFPDSRRMPKSVLLKIRS
jgi:hypothetical protein